jgi:hypothetical protein
VTVSPWKEVLVADSFAPVCPQARLKSFKFQL